jgi:polyphosphate kinase
MVRSFERRIESLFLLMAREIRQQAILILDYNLRDNVNSYDMQENGDYYKCLTDGTPFNIHQEFFKITNKEIDEAKLF